ncbi:MAG: amidohydrolase family protein [Chloroflexota bacterium]|jgi:predicted TIM-barrel fold metal-dependent hydrolase
MQTPPLIIDIHQHYLPALPTWFDEPWQSALYHESRVQGYADVGRVIGSMDSAGIDMCVWQGEYVVQMANCVSQNDTVLAAMRHNPQRLRAFAMIQPNHPGAIDEIARCVAGGMCGVGELNPVAQQFSLRSPAFLRCAEYCAMHRLPMLFHVNEPVGSAYPGKVDQPMWAYYELAARFPELTIILAHWGGGLWFYEQIPSVRRVLRNVYYDTAASWLTYPDTATMVQMAMMVVPDKVLFGSDFPLKKPTAGEPDLTSWFNEVLDATPESWRSAVSGGAAHTILAQAGTLQLRHTPPSMPIDERASVVWLVDTYPATVAVLTRWRIDVTAHTPWWQSIAHAAVSAGHHPQLHAQLIDEIRAVIV